MTAAIHPFPPRIGLTFAEPPPPRPLIIGLAGPIGCGKSTAARALEAQHGFARTRFAGALKGMFRTLLMQAGFGGNVIDRMVEGDLKEQPCPALGFRTPRHAMQTLGTQWGRDRMSPDLWCALWGQAARALIESGHRRVVVEDLRFANEAATVRALGGMVIYIERPSAESARLARRHESEAFEFQPDRVIPNTGVQPAFEATVSRMVQEMVGGE